MDAATGKSDRTALTPGAFSWMNHPARRISLHRARAFVNSILTLRAPAGVTRGDEGTARSCWRWLARRGKCVRGSSSVRISRSSSKIDGAG
jgi:hypothetical protein